MFRPFDLRRPGSGVRPSGADLKAVLAIAVLLVAALAVVTVATDANTTGGTEDEGETSGAGETENTLYVSTSGDDSTGDGTQSKPYATLGKAYTKASTSSSTTIYLRDNITVGSNLSLNSNKTVVISSESASDKKTITASVSGSDSRDSFFKITGGGSVTFQDVIIDGSGVLSDGATEVGGEWFGAIYVENGTVTLGDGAVVQNFKWNGTQQGMAILFASGGENIQSVINITSGSTITNCKATYDNEENPAGIVIAGSGGVVTMTGGEISRNTGTVIVGLGSDKNPNFTMTGGSIKDNTVNAKYAAVYMRGAFDTSTLVFGGSAYVYDNKDASSNQRNIYLKNSSEDAFFGISSVLTGDAKLGITAERVGDNTLVARGSGCTIDSSDATHVESDLGVSSIGVRYVSSDQTIRLSTDGIFVGSTISDGSKTKGTRDNPYTSLAEAYSAVDISNRIILLSNIELTGTFNLDANKTITITSDGDSTYSLTRGSGCSGTMLNVTAGSVTLTNVTVDGKNSGGDFLVKVGASSGAPSLTLDSKATIQNGTGGGILLGVNGNSSSVGKLTILDGATVTGNSGGDTYGDSTDHTTVGGIQIFGSTTFVMNGGTISNNTGGWAGGINVYSNSGGRAEINGGTISGNTATSGAGGIFADTDGKIVLNGGTITGNKSTSSHYGGVAEWDGTATAEIRIGGGVSTPLRITGNTASGDVATDVYLKSDNVIPRVDGKVLAAGSEIKIMSSSMPPSSPIQVVASSTEAEKSYFFSDMPHLAGISRGTSDSNTAIYLSFGARDGKDVYVSSNGNDSTGNGSTDKPYLTIAKAYKMVTDGGTIHVMTNLDQNTTVSMNESKAVTIASYNGNWSLDRTGTGGTTMFNVTAGTLTLKGITLDGKCYQTTYGKAIEISGASTIVNLQSGTTIQNFYTSTAQSGFSTGTVVVKGSGTINMSDGVVIKGNKAFDGPGIMLHATGSEGNPTLNMSGGEISGNYACGVNNGGGKGSAIYVADQYGQVTVNISGGSITGNFASNGGAIRTYGSSSTITITAGNIKENGSGGSSPATPAGVWMAGGTLVVGGTAVINENCIGSSWNVTSNTVNLGTTTQSNLYIASGQTVTISSTSPLQSGANIGIYTAVAPASGTDVQFATGATNVEGQMSSAFFHSDRSNEENVVYGDGNLYLSTTSTQIIVNIVLPTGVILGDGSGSVIQTIQKGSSIDGIVLKAHSNYSALANDQATKIGSALSGAGLTVTFNETSKTITISGTPTSGIYVDLRNVLGDSIPGMQAVAKNSDGTESGYATVGDALEKAKNGGITEIVAEGTGLTEVSSATLKNGVKLTTDMGSITAQGDATTISMDSDGRITLLSGKGLVDGKATISVEIPDSKTVEVQIHEDEEYLIDVSGKTVSGLSSGNSVVIDGITFTAGEVQATGGSFPLDVSAGKLSVSGDQAEIPSGQAASITLGQSETPVVVKEGTNEGVTTLTYKSPSTIVLGKTGDTFQIGEATYTAGSDGAKFTIDGSGIVKLIDGSAVLNKGDSITADSGEKIANPEDSGSEQITVSVDQNGETVIIPTNRGNVKIGDSEYEATVENTHISIDGNGKAELIKGSVELEKDGSIYVEGKEVKNTGDEGVVVTVGDSSDDGTVAIPSGGQATIGGVTISGGQEVEAVIGTNGEVTINIPSTGSITVDGVTYTGGSGAKITIGVDGSVSATDVSTITVPDTGIKDGSSYTLNAGQAMTIGGYVYTVPADAGSVTITGRGSANPLVTLNEGTSKVSVSLKNSEGTSATYAADGAGTAFAMSEDSDVTKVNLVTGESGFTVPTGTTVTVGDSAISTQSEDAVVGLDTSGGIKLISGQATSNGEMTAAVGGKDYAFQVQNSTGYTVDTDNKTVGIFDKDSGIQIDGVTYTAGQDGTTFNIGDSGVTVENEGDKVTVPGSITSDATFTIGSSTVTVPGGDSGDVNVTKTVSGATVVLDRAGDSFRVNGSTYTATTDGAEFSIDQNGNVAKKEVIEALSDGQSVTGASGKVISNPAGTGSDTIYATIGSSAGEDTVTVPSSGGKVAVGGTVYEAAEDNTTIVVTSDGVRLASGALKLDAGETAVVNGTTVAGTAGEVTVSVGSGGSSEISIPSGSGAAIGNVEIETDGGDVDVTVGRDGKLRVTSDSGRVEVDGIIYTGDGAIELTVDPRTGEVTGTGLDVEIPADVLTEGFSFALEPGQTATVGGYTYTAPAGGSKGDVTISGRGAGTAPAVVLDGSAGVTVALVADPGASSGYAATSDGASFAMSSDDTVTKDIDLISGTLEVSNGTSVSSGAGGVVADGDATIGIGSDGLLTLSEGRAAVGGGTEIIVGGVVVSVPEGTGCIADADASVVEGVDGGESVTIGGITHVSGRDGRSIPIGEGVIPIAYEGDGVSVPGSVTDDVEVSAAIGDGSADIVIPGGNAGSAEVSKTSAGVVVTLEKEGDSFSLGGETYTAGSDGAQFTIDGDGNVKVTGGSSKLESGDSVTGASGRTISNTGGSGSDPVKVTMDGSSGKDTITIPSAGGKVAVDGEEYTAASDDTVIEVTGDAVSLISGSVELDEGEGIASDGVHIENTGDVTVGVSVGEVSVPEGGSVDIGGIDIGASEGDAVIGIDAEGVLEVTGGPGSVTVDGLIYTGEDIALEVDTATGEVTVTEGGVTIPDGKLVDGFIYIVEPWIAVTAGGCTYTALEDGVAIHGRGEGVAPAIVLEEGSEVQVAPADDPDDENTYVAGDGGAEFAVSGSGDAASVDLIGGRIVIPAGEGSDVAVGDISLTILGGNAGSAEIAGIPGGAVVTLEKEGDSFGFDGSTYTAGSDGTQFTIDGDGVRITGGSAELGAGESLTGASGRTIANPDGSGTDIVVSIDGSSGKDTVTVPSAGGKAAVDGTEYTTASDDTVIEVTGDATSLISGSVLLDGGEGIAVSGVDVENTGDGTVKVSVGEVVIPDGGSADIGGTEIAADGGDAKVEIGTDGGLEVAGGPGAITVDGIIYTGEDIELDVDPSAGTVEVGKGDVTIPSDKLTGDFVYDPTPGMHVTIGGYVYTASDDGATLQGRGAGLEPAVVLDGGSGITVAPTGDAGAWSSYTAGTGGAVIVMSGPGDSSSVDLIGGRISVDGGKAAGEGSAIAVGGSVRVTVPAGSGFEVDADASLVDGVDRGENVSIDGVTYTSGVDGGSFPIVAGGSGSLSSDGDRALVPGSIVSDVSVAVGDETVVIPGTDTGDVEIVRTSGGATVDLTGAGDSFTVGGVTYTSLSDGAGFAIGNDGDVAITGGSVRFDDGASVTGVSGMTIGNPADSLGDSLTVSSDPSSGTDTVTIPSAGGKASVGDTVYTTAEDGTVLAVTGDGVSLISGSVTIGGGDSIVVGDGSIQNTGSTGITVSAGSDGSGQVTVPAGGSAEIGGSDVGSTSGDVTFVIGTDGGVRVDLAEGETVVIGDRTYKGVGTDGTGYTIDPATGGVTGDAEAEVTIDTGTDSGSSEKHAVGEVIELPKEQDVDTSSKEGSVLVGWKVTDIEGNTTDYGLGSEYVVGSDAKVDAVWVDSSDVMVYTTETGGTLEGRSYEILGGGTVTLKDTGVSKDGYRFAGWTSKDDGDVAYAPGMSLSADETVGCMQAYFVKEEYACRLVYDSEGGTGSIADQWVEPGKYVKLPTALDMTRKGYTFVGWATENSVAVDEPMTLGADPYVLGAGQSGRTLIDDAYYQVTADETIYAVWEAKQIIIPGGWDDDDDPIVIPPVEETAEKTDFVPYLILIAAIVAMVEIVVLVEHRRR